MIYTSTTKIRPTPATTVPLNLNPHLYTLHVLIANCFGQKCLLNKEKKYILLS